VPVAIRQRLNDRGAAQFAHKVTSAA
jgi:hypothetical protein